MGDKNPLVKSHILCNGIDEEISGWDLREPLLLLGRN